MKKITEKKRVTLTFTKILLDDGYVFDDAYELLELLETADEVDGYFERIILSNNWGKKLDEMGVLSRSSRGSYSKGKNHKDFWDKVFFTVYGKNRNE